MVRPGVRPIRIERLPRGLDISQSWLIWAKLINLAALIWLRATVIRRYYPNSTLY